MGSLRLPNSIHLAAQLPNRKLEIQDLRPIPGNLSPKVITNTSRLIGTYRGSRDDSFGLHSQASFNTGNADAV